MPDNTEQHRHRTEVRWCLRQGRAWLDGYVKGVADKRGREAAQRLWTDVREQARAGNTGEPGMWIESPMEPT